MRDSSRLREIERELDKTSPWEGAPYRQWRQKLNRERKRILKRMNGMDPRWFAKGGDADDLRMKREILVITQLITDNKEEQ